MVHLWQLAALVGAVIALPNRPISSLSSSSPRSEICSVTVDGMTLSGPCTTAVKLLQARQGVCQEVIDPTDAFQTRCTSTLVDSVGRTIVIDAAGTITLSPDVTTPVTKTFSNGDVTTVDPLEIVIVTTNSASETVYSNVETAVTVPTGITTPIQTVLNGVSTTITPDPAPEATSSSSSEAGVGLILPVTTLVESPKSTQGGIIVPCDFFWFLNTCPTVDNIEIAGWAIQTLVGIQPPGPPPALTFPPGGSLSISIPTPLPDWPKWTLPPTGTPQASPKPTNCQTETGELCVYHTTFSPVTTNQVTTTSTQVHSTCATVIGCEAADEETSTSTTAIGSAATLTYAVYPSEGTNRPQVNAIGKELEKSVNDVSDVQPSDTETFGLNYWLLALNDTSVEDVRKIPDVLSVYAECGLPCPNDAACDYSCYDPATMRVYQDNAPPQLTYLSWSKLLPVKDERRYLFDDSAGEDIPVYVVDTGAKLSNAEFDLVRDKARWIFGGPDVDGTLASETDSENSKRVWHGTAMLSPVTGKTLGVAKRVEPILVPLPAGLWYEDPNPEREGVQVYRGGYSPQTYLRSLGKVLDEIGEGPKAEASCVVLLAQYYPTGLFGNPEEASGFRHRLWTQIEEFAKRGAIVVTGAGNILKESGQPLDGWPANFGKTNQDEFNSPSLIVAGALYGETEVTIYSGPTSGIPHVYAPGIGMQVANGNPLAGDEAIRTTARGTSEASARVAGLAAYFLKLSQLGRLNHADGTPVDRAPQGIKQFMFDQAWSRHDTGRNGIFNAVDPGQRYCPWNPDGASLLLRRQDDNPLCFVPLDNASPTESTVFKPMVTQSPVCHNEDDYPNHGDVRKSAVVFNAGAACSIWTGSPNRSSDTELGPDSSKRSHTYTTNGVDYRYSVEWVEGCTTTVEKESVYSPEGSDEFDLTCQGLLSNCYDECYNGGVGGSIIYGCLKYTSTGGG